MRRIAAVTMTAVALSVGAGLIAAPANAAPAQRKVTKNWVTFDGKKGSIWRTIKSYGTYTRNGNKITTRGYLQDTTRNGWSPAVQFRVWRDGSWHVSDLYYASYNNIPADFKFTYHYKAGKPMWQTTGTKLQVREAAVKRTNEDTHRVSNWKSLF